MVWAYNDDTGDDLLGVRKCYGMREAIPGAPVYVWTLFWFMSETIDWEVFAVYRSFALVICRLLEVS